MRLLIIVSIIIISLLVPNIDKLTNKLTPQLIEECDRALCVYHNSVSHFKLLIDNCMDIKKRFQNIERSYLPLQFHTNELYQSAVCTIYNLQGSSSDAANVGYNNCGGSNTPTSTKSVQTNAFRSTRIISNAKNKDVTPELPLIAKDLIRKPIQMEVNKVPITAYNELYISLSHHVERALKDLQIITDLYHKPLDLSLYIEHNPHKQVMTDFDDTTRASRQADGIWHQYNIAVRTNNDLLPELSSNRYLIDGDTKEDINIDNDAPLLLATPTTLNNRIRCKSEDHREDDDGNQMCMSPLTLTIKVSSQEVHNKRYSIV